MAKRLFIPLFLGWMSLGPLFCQKQAGFIYVSNQRILTLELVERSSAVVNYINLNESYELVRATHVVLLDDQGNGYRGHVFSVEGEAGEPGRFEVSDLLKPGQFQGYLLRGDLGPLASVVRAGVALGGRVVELERLDAETFEILAARVAELDLGLEDRALALERVGFRRGYGELHESLSPEAEQFIAHTARDDVLAPILLKNPAPKMPSSRAGKFAGGTVQISALVSSHGGIKSLEVKQGLDPLLDEMALETVRNSWMFLPAISNGKVVDSELTLNVRFE